MIQTVLIFSALIAQVTGVCLRGRASPGGDCKTPSVEDLAVAFEDHPVGEPYVDARADLDAFNTELAKLGSRAGPDWGSGRVHSYESAFGSSSASAKPPDSATAPTTQLRSNY